MLCYPGDVRPRGHDFEPHELEGVEHDPGGQAELGLLLPVVVVLGLILDLLGQDADLVVVQTLDRAPVLDGILAHEDVGHSVGGPPATTRLLGSSLPTLAL